MKMHLAIVLFYVSVGLCIDNAKGQSHSTKFVSSSFKRSLYHSIYNFRLNDTCISEPQPLGSEVSYCYLSKDEVILYGSKSTYDYDDSTNKSPFYNLSLSKVQILDNVTQIGKYLFYMSVVQTFQISKSVTKISLCAFKQCLNLTKFEVNERNTQFSSIDGVLLSKNLTLLYYYPIGKTNEQYVIPFNVTKITEYAFGYSTYLKSITIQKLTKSIHEFAFSNCVNLAHFSVDENNRNYTAINGVLFSKEKDALVKYPIGKTDESYSIPNTVKAIHMYAFENCRFLKTLQIGNNLTTIKAYSFTQCTSLEAIHVDKSNRNFTSLDGVLISKDMTKLIKYPSGKTDATYQIPDNVTSISIYSFDYCHKLESLTGSYQLTNISVNAFTQCTSLKSFVVNSLSIGSITPGFIGTKAFDFCPKLETVVINRFNWIRKSAFHNCPLLNSFTYYGEIGPNCSTNAFDNCANLKKVNVRINYQSNDFCGIPIDKYPISGSGTIDPTSIIPSETSMPISESITTSEPLTITQTQTQTAQPTESPDSSSSKKAGLIVGLTVGFAAAIIIAAVVVVILKRRHSHDGIVDPLLSQSISITEDENNKNYTERIDS